MSDSNLDLKSIRQKQAEKFAQHQAEQEKLKQEQDNKLKQEQDEAKFVEEQLRLQEEERLQAEMELSSEYENIVAKLETITVEILSAENIIEIDLQVTCFATLLESAMKFFYDYDKKKEISDRVIMMINSISQNPNSKFDVTLQDSSTEASKKIADNIKLCLTLVDYDDSSINVELMNTEDDAEYAKKLEEEQQQEQHNDQNDNFHEFPHMPHFPTFPHFHRRQEMFKKRLRIFDGRDDGQDDIIDIDNVIKIDDVPPHLVEQPNNDHEFAQVNFGEQTNTNNVNNNLGFTDADFVDDDFVNEDLIDEDFSTVISNHDCFNGLENIDDPELVQLMMYQNDLLNNK